MISGFVTDVLIAQENAKQILVFSSTWTIPHPNALDSWMKLFKFPRHYDTRDSEHTNSQSPVLQSLKMEKMYWWNTLICQQTQRGMVIPSPKTFSSRSLNHASLILSLRNITPMFILVWLGHTRRAQHSWRSLMMMKMWLWERLSIDLSSWMGTCFISATLITQHGCHQPIPFFRSCEWILTNSAQEWSLTFTYRSNA